MYPLTEILSPGPISNGRLNKALFATALELMEDKSEFNGEIPSPELTVFVGCERGAGASRSVGDEL